MFNFNKTHVSSCVASFQKPPSPGSPSLLLLHDIIFDTGEREAGKVGGEGEDKLRIKYLHLERLLECMERAEALGKKIKLFDTLYILGNFFVFSFNIII